MIDMSKIDMSKLSLASGRLRRLFMGFLVLILVLLGIIVLASKANKATGGIVGSAAIGIGIVIAVLFARDRYNATHLPPNEPLGAVVSEPLIRNELWNSEDQDSEICRWYREKGMPCGPPMVPTSEVIWVAEGSPAWTAGLRVGDFVDRTGNIDSSDPTLEMPTQRDKSSDDARALGAQLRRKAVYVLRRSYPECACSLNVWRADSPTTARLIVIAIPHGSHAQIPASSREDRLPTPQRLPSAPPLPHYEAPPDPIYGKSKAVTNRVLVDPVYGASGAPKTSGGPSTSDQLDASPGSIWDPNSP